MNDLLKMAVAAHGGLSRWNELATVKANVSVTGVIWHLKGKPDALNNISIEAQLHQERITTHFIGQDRRMMFEPNRIVIETEAGNYLNSRQPPGEPKALANGKAPIFHFTLNQDTSFAVLGARQPNDPRGLGDYKVSQAIKNQVEKI